MRSDTIPTPFTKLEFGDFLAPPLGWCNPQRIKISMIAGGNHTTIHAGTALAVTERALSALRAPLPKGEASFGFPCFKGSQRHPPVIAKVAEGHLWQSVLPLAPPLGELSRL